MVKRVRKTSSMMLNKLELVPSANANESTAKLNMQAKFLTRSNKFEQHLVGKKTQYFTKLYCTNQAA